MRNSEVQECIDRCQECHTICLETVQYCSKKGGQYSETESLSLLSDCAQICQTSADFMKRESRLSNAICELCAKICELCADVCEQMSDDSQMKKCADACRRCMESCREVPEGKVPSKIQWEETTKSKFVTCLPWLMILALFFSFQYSAVSAQGEKSKQSEMSKMLMGDMMKDCQEHCRKTLSSIDKASDLIQEAQRTTDEAKRRSSLDKAQKLLSEAKEHTSACREMMDSMKGRCPMCGMMMDESGKK